MDWSRPSPSSPRLPGWGSVQSDLPVGPDRTEPYPRPGPSGLVESLRWRVEGNGSCLKKPALQCQWASRSRILLLWWKIFCCTLKSRCDWCLLLAILNDFACTNSFGTVRPCTVSAAVTSTSAFTATLTIPLPANSHAAVQSSCGVCFSLTTISLTFLLCVIVHFSSIC